MNIPTPEQFAALVEEGRQMAREHDRRAAGMRQWRCLSCGRSEDEPAQPDCPELCHVSHTVAGHGRAAGTTRRR